LTLLGPGQKAGKKLENFPNHHQSRDYVVTLESRSLPAFAGNCQPDSLPVTIQYTPEEKILESKSLKLYLWSYRDQPVFHEHVTNAILDDLIKSWSLAGVK